MHPRFFVSTRRLAPIGLAAAVACVGGSRSAPSSPVPTPVLLRQVSGTAALLQAVSPVSDQVVWVSGHAGTYARTTDGGATWQAAIVPGADSLQFRDVHAVDVKVAYLMSAGPGERSRIYKTVDAGRTWTLQFTNQDAKAFFDCMDFWDADHGIAFSDAVDGEFPVIVTADGGKTWNRLPAAAVPAALPGEGGFAASGTCLVARPSGHAWIGTGNASGARVLRTTDRGRSWLAAPTPIMGGDGAGVTSLAFRDARHGVAMGGEIGKPDARSDNVATTSDGGQTWTLAARPPFTGAIYGGAYVPNAPAPTIVAVGPKGAAYSADNARSWIPLDTMSYWSVAFATPSAGWAVGPGGRITKIRLF